MRHVPYDARQQNDVLYIMDPPRQRSNGMGITGFVLALVGIGTCGLTSPLGLLFSLFGMFRAPRGLATAGLLISAVPTALWGVAFYAGINQDHFEHRRLVDERRAAETRRVLGDARDTIERQRALEDGQTLEGIAGNMLVVEMRGGWKEEIRYEPVADGYNLRSSGRDHDFDTRDDVLIQVRPGDLANVAEPQATQPASY